MKVDYIIWGIKEIRIKALSLFSSAGISELFVEYIDLFGLDEFTSAYNDYQSEPQKLFKGFLELIITKIEKAGKKSKIPILVRTGVLLGTGIENISIMDSKIVHDLPIPLIILYPATEAGDKR